MRDLGFFIRFAILLSAQILLSNFFNFSQYIVLSFLPAMILFTPPHRPVSFNLILSFVAGFLVDFFSTGMLGLTSAALLPVAFCRNGISRIAFGPEVSSRDENPSFERQGVRKMSFAILLCSLLFMMLYVWIDAAGTMEFRFLLLKTVLSTAVSSLASVLAASIITSASMGKWR